MDDVGHKSPKSKTAFGAIVNQTQKKEKKSSSSTRMASSSEPKLNFEEFFPDDMSMNSIVQSFAQMDEDGLSFHDTSDAFNFGSWRSAPVETILENRNATCAARKTYCTRM